MAAFYWKIHSDIPLIKQWESHIQTQRYVKDVTDAIQKQTEEYNRTIERVSEQHKHAMRGAMNAVCGTLTDGFQKLSVRLDDINDSLYEIRSLLSWELSTLIEEQRINNLLTKNNAVLLRVPDSQKQRQYHFEQGMRFLENARKIDTDFYEDAIDNLLKAEDIERTDYFVLHRIGIVFLYSPKHLNLHKAEAYFKKAARYAAADTHPQAIRQANILNADLNYDLENQFLDDQSVKQTAARSLMQAGISVYLQENIQESIELFSKAILYAPYLLEAKFALAKSYLAANQDTQAASTLEDVIRLNSKYSIAAAEDPDFATNTKIQAVLQKLQVESQNEAKKLLETSNDITFSLLNEWKIKESTHYNEFLRLHENVKQAERLINHGAYLNCLEAQDKLRTFINSVQ